MIGDLTQDLRDGVRSFTRNPSFTLVAVLALAVGIGANTAVFTVLNAIILRPLPYEGADRLVWVWGNNNKLGINQGYLSNADIYDFQQHSTNIESIAAWTTLPVNLIEETTSERLEGILVSPSFFSCLGVSIKIGRDFHPVTFGGVACLLTFVALLACYVPTLRAIKVDPLIAIREQ